MTCWTDIVGIGDLSVTVMGGPSGRAYAWESSQFNVYSALDGTLIDSNYLPYSPVSSIGVFAVPSTDQTVAYYTDYDSGTTLRKTTHGGSDVLVGSLLYGAVPIFFFNMVWLPGVGLVGWGNDQNFPIGNEGLYSIDTTTGACSSLVANVFANGGYRLVTSDNVLWWAQQGAGPGFHTELHAYDGSAHYILDTYPAYFNSLLTFNPDDPTQVLINYASSPVTPDLRFFALISGTITQMGTSGCETLHSDGYAPVWTFDYVAADNWGDSSHTQLWRFQAPAAGGWHVGSLTF